MQVKETTVPEEDVKESPVKVEDGSNTEIEVEQMDTIDKAIADKEEKKEEGYESSDIELSSDDESDSSSSRYAKDGILL